MSTFAQFTDPALMRTLLQEQLPHCQQGNGQITTCQVLHAQYYANIRHPLRSWLGVCYAVTFACDALDNPTAEPCPGAPQLLYGRARLGGQSQREFDQAQAAPLWSPPVGPPVVHLPQLDMTIWSFPNDPQLPHLPQVIDPTLVRAHLPYTALPAGFNDPAAVAQVEIAVVHYYPAERCTNRYTLWSKRPDRPEPLILFGKTFNDESGSALFARLEAMWQRAQVEPELFGVTKPLAYTATSKTLWLQFQPGRPLGEVLTPENAAHLLGKIARGLAALQWGNLPDLPIMTPAERLDEIHDKAQKLAHTQPAWQPMLAELLNELQQSAATLPPAPITLLHGDFHLRQFLVDGEQIVCCDFDEVAQGDPLQDVASFLVDMAVSPVATGLTPALAQHFYETYRHYAPWDTAPARLAWQLRYQFFTKAYRFYRQQRPDWQQQAQKMLTLAQGIALTEHRLFTFLDKQ